MRIKKFPNEWIETTNGKILSSSNMSDISMKESKLFLGLSNLLNKNNTLEIDAYKEIKNIEESKKIQVYHENDCLNIYFHPTTITIQEEFNL